MAGKPLESSTDLVPCLVFHVDVKGLKMFGEHWRTTFLLRFVFLYFIFLDFVVPKCEIYRIHASYYFLKNNCTSFILFLKESLSNNRTPRVARVLKKEPCGKPANPKSFGAAEFSLGIVLAELICPARSSVSKISQKHQ